MMDESLLQDFIVETSEHLEEIEKNLLKLSSGQEDSELLNDIFRSIHTIKGSSEYLGMVRIADLSHRMENLLDKMRQKSIVISDKVIDTLIAGTDRVALLMDELSHKGGEESDIDDLVKQLENVEKDDDDNAGELRQSLKGYENNSLGKQDEGIDTPDLKVTYEEDYDTELFDIFVEQLLEGLESLKNKAEAIFNGNGEEGFKEESIKNIKVLCGSANYMGYEELVGFYEEWCDEISRNSEIDPKSMMSQIAIVIGMFPKAEGLKGLLNDITAFQAENMTENEHEDQENDNETASLEIGLKEEDLSPLDDPVTDFSGEDELLIVEDDQALLLDDEDDHDLLLEKDEIIEEDIESLSLGEEDFLDTEDNVVSEALPADDSLLNDFIVETGEHLDEVEGNLLRLSSGPDDAEMLNDIFRSIHTIKGSSEYLGMERIAKLSHLMENLLDRMRNKEVIIDETVIDTLISGRDRIGMLIEELSHFGSEKSEVDDIIDRIENFNQAETQHASDDLTSGDESEGLSISEAGFAEDNTLQSTYDVVYEEDSDTELFEIFIEQVHEGLSYLKEGVGGLAEGPAAESVLKQCVEKLESLKTSSHYMGYDRLADVYNDWSDELSQGITTGNFQNLIPSLPGKFVNKISIIAAMFPTTDVFNDLLDSAVINDNQVETESPETVDVEGQETIAISEIEDSEDDGSISFSGTETYPDEEEFEQTGVESLDAEESFELSGSEVLDDEQIFDLSGDDASEDDGIIKLSGTEAVDHDGIVELSGMETFDDESVTDLVDTRIIDGEGDFDQEVLEDDEPEEPINFVDTRIIDGEGDFAQEVLKDDEPEAVIDLVDTKIIDGEGDFDQEVLEDDEPEEAIDPINTRIIDGEGDFDQNVMEDDEPEEVIDLVDTKIIDGEGDFAQEVLEDDEPDEVIDLVDTRIIDGEGDFAQEELEDDEPDEVIDLVDTRIIDGEGDFSQEELEDDESDEVIDLVDTRIIDGEGDFSQEVLEDDESEEIIDLVDGRNVEDKEIVDLVFKADEITVAEVDDADNMDSEILELEEIVSSDFEEYEESVPTDTDGTDAILSEELSIEDFSGDGAESENELIELSEIVATDYFHDDSEYARQTEGLIEKLENAFEANLNHEDDETEESGADKVEENISASIDSESSIKDESKSTHSKPVSTTGKDDSSKLEDKDTIDNELENDRNDSPVESLNEDKFQTKPLFEIDDIAIPSSYTDEMVASLRAEFDLSNAENNSAIDRPAIPSEMKSPEKDNKKTASTQNKNEKTEKITERPLNQSVRVDAGKIDALINQVGELVVNRAFFSQLYNEMRSFEHYLRQNDMLEKKDLKQIKGLTYRLSEATLSLGRVANDLQEKVMRVRMQPISQLFNRYPRLVHDLVKGVDKKVRLDIIGEDTELDRMVIERIADPMIHIIRNSIDHGIETTSERVRSKKPATGTLRLEAYHEGNHVVIKVFDDGRGIDIERIKSKAVEKQLLTRDEIERMSERELTSLIMQPGFSTASQITHTSGRGVGMDVVKKNVEKLNGTLEVESKFGIETCIRIKIPLTLAIIPALLVRVREDLFTIPLSAVDETIRVFGDEINTIEGLEVFHLRDEAIPILRLTEVLNIDTKGNSNKDFVVVVRTGDTRVGLVVDDLLGQEEVVIKPLEDYLQENTGFSGATILGDGRISLILDVYELINLCRDKQAKRNALNSLF